LEHTHSPGKRRMKVCSIGLKLKFSGILKSIGKFEIFLFSFSENSEFGMYGMLKKKFKFFFLNNYFTDVDIERKSLKNE